MKKKNDLSCKHACAVVSPRGDLKISFFVESEELENFHNILQLDTVITYILTDRNGQVFGGWGEFNCQSVVTLLILMVYLATWFIICFCYLKMRLVVTKDSILESFFFFCFHEKKNNLSCKHACAVVSPRGELKIYFLVGCQQLERLLRQSSTG